MKNIYKTTLIILIIVSLLICGGCLNTTLQKTEKPIVTVLKTADNQNKFDSYLQNHEFLGYVVKSQTSKATYFYGLIYDGSDEDGIETPLLSVITLTGEENPTLIAQDKLNFKENGGVLPEDTENTELCTAFACDGNVFIQVNENPYSEYVVLHQLLVDGEGLLSTAESAETTGDFLSAEGKNYTIWQNRWCQLNTYSNTITYHPIDVEKFRPKYDDDDIVITYNYENRSPHEVTFKVNGKKITPGQDMFENTRKSPTIGASAQSKIFFLQTAEYPMQCNLNYALTETIYPEGDFGEISDSDFGQQGIGYVAFNPSYEYSKAYLFASPFVDYSYNFTITLK